MIVKLGDIAREYKCTTGNKDCPIVGLEHLEPKELLLKNYASDPNTTFTKSFKAGQILFGRRRSYQQKASVATFDGICSGDIIVIEAIPEKIEPRLLPFIIQNEAFFNYSIIGSAGGLSPRVKWQHLANYEFELPSLEEQRVLADKLWAAYEVKESYKNLLAQTDKLLHAQFEKMFGDIEKTVPLKTCANVITGSTPSKSRPEYWNNGTYYWVSAFDMKEKYIKDTLEKVTQKGYDTCRKLPIGSILYVCRGSIGVMAINSVECACNQSICAATCHENWDNEFIYYVLKYCSENIQKQYGEGTSFKSISQSTFMNLPIPDVPYNAQVEFREFIEQAEQTKASLNKGIEAIEAVIRSLIAEGTTKV